MGLRPKASQLAALCCVFSMARKAFKDKVFWLLILKLLMFKESRQVLLSTFKSVCGISFEYVDNGKCDRF